VLIVHWCRSWVLTSDYGHLLVNVGCKNAVEIQWSFFNRFCEWVLLNECQMGVECGSLMLSMFLVGLVATTVHLSRVHGHRRVGLGVSKF
jgi:hypothetical protein